MAEEPIIGIERLTHRYGDRVALDSLSLGILPGEIFALLGPNGSGKSTLFRILSTLMKPSSSDARIIAVGEDLLINPEAVRRKIGVVFQSPSIDKVLTASENLMHHGHLYGLSGIDLRNRIASALQRVNLSDRANDRVDGFSGGMRRRVEIAKCLLTDPKLMLMDEPSTGLDPAARIDLGKTLTDLQSQGVTIVLTTHLMDEADRASRIAILSHGRLIACETPDALKHQIGGEVIILSCENPVRVSQILKEQLGLLGEIIENTVRIEHRDAHKLVPQLIESAPGLISSVSVGKPTLEDVFIHLTGHTFRDEVNQAGSTPLPPHG